MLSRAGSAQGQIQCCRRRDHRETLPRNSGRLRWTVRAVLGRSYAPIPRKRPQGAVGFADTLLPGRDSRVDAGPHRASQGRAVQTHQASRIPREIAAPWQSTELFTIQVKRNRAFGACASGVSKTRPRFRAAGVDYRRTDCAHDCHLAAVQSRPLPKTTRSRCC